MSPVNDILTLLRSFALWVMTEGTRSGVQAAERRFLFIVIVGIALIGRVRINVTRGEFGVELLLLQIRKGQMR